MPRHSWIEPVSAAAVEPVGAVDVLRRNVLSIGALFGVEPRPVVGGRGGGVVPVGGGVRQHVAVVDVHGTHPAADVAVSRAEPTRQMSAGSRHARRRARAQERPFLAARVQQDGRLRRCSCATRRRRAARPRPRHREAERRRLQPHGAGRQGRRHPLPRWPLSAARLLERPRPFARRRRLRRPPRRPRSSRT